MITAADIQKALEARDRLVASVDWAMFGRMQHVVDTAQEGLAALDHTRSLVPYAWKSVSLIPNALALTADPDSLVGTQTLRAMARAQESLAAMERAQSAMRLADTYLKSLDATTNMVNQAHQALAGAQGSLAAIQEAFDGPLGRLFREEADRIASREPLIAAQMPMFTPVLDWEVLRPTPRPLARSIVRREVKRRIGFK